MTFLRPYTIAFRATTLSLLCAIPIRAAQLGDVPANVQWTTTIGDSIHAFRGRHIIVSMEDGASTVLAGTYSESTLSNRKSKVLGIWIKTFNTDGKDAASFDLKNDDTHNFADVEAFSRTRTGHLLLVLRTIDGETQITILSARGELISETPLERGVHASALLPLANDDFYLLGHKNLVALVMRISAVGKGLKEMWRVSSDRGGQGMVLDGVITGNDGLVVTENSGKLEQFFMGESNIWVVKYDSAGHRLAETQFKGRAGSLVSSSDGGYSICYDRSASSAQSISLQSLDNDLRVRWQQPVVDIKFGLEPFVVSATQRGLAIFGQEYNRPRMAYFSKAGEKKWVYLAAQETPAIAVIGKCSGALCTVMSTQPAIKNDNQVVNKVNVMQLLLVQ